MLYQFLYNLRDQFSVLNVFGYITFRAALAGMTAFLVSLVFGGWFIRRLRQSNVFEDTSKPDAEKLNELHSGKNHTPTMGGVMILVGVMASALLWAEIANVYVALCLAVMLSLGWMGLCDDWLKLRFKRTGAGPRGLTKKMKLVGQFLLGLGVGLILWRHTRDAEFATRVYLPFFKDASVNLGVFIIPWTAAVIAFASNSVNITDGIDGLAAGCSTVTVVALAGLCYVVGRMDYSGYLQIAYVPGVAELSILCAALVGGLLGFLWYNCHPADIFMGDTGALPLGGMIGFIALAAKYEALLLLIGAVFVAEMLSVMLQVGSFKATGKRVFSIAPFHHALEYLGWHENKITVRLWILAAVAAGAGLITLKLR